VTVSIINGSGAGWSPYVLGRNGDREHSLIVAGDTLLGDKICQSADHYKSGSAVKVVVSFTDEDKVTPERGCEIVKDFLKEFMHGFREDEYHTDIVEHTDTDHLHYHIRIPKLNLLTGTQLKVYFHKTDLDYKIATIDYIAQKHDLTIGTDRKKLVPDTGRRLEQINKWRREHGQKLFDLSSKGGRGEAEDMLLDYFIEMNMQGFIESLGDITTELESMGFEIVKIDRDKGKNFDYVTVQNDSGKIRLKGDIYGTEFYENNREDRAKAISNNRGFSAGSQSDRRSRNDIRQALHKERQRRLRWIDKQYGSARKRAIQRLQEEQRPFDNEHSENEKTATKSSSPSHPYTWSVNRNFGNSLFPQTVTKRNISEQNSDWDWRGKILPDETTQRKGIEDDDRITTTAIRRVRGDREGSERRAELIRAEFEKAIRRNGEAISRQLDHYFGERKQRWQELSAIVAKHIDPTEYDYQAIERATKERGHRRKIEEDFDASISIIRASLDNLFRRVKQEFGRRTQNLIEGVVNEIKKKQLFERGKKKVLSKLRHKKIKLTPRR
jgi:hypothetical protein